MVSASFNIRDNGGTNYAACYLLGGPLAKITASPDYGDLALNSIITGK